MTRRSRVQPLAPADLLEIHPADARREQLSDGARSELTSRWGRTDVVVRLSERVAPGTLFLSFHHPETHTNRVIGPHRDPISNCPEYKVTAVRLRRLTQQ
jgi:predicted molibdopterin-dependent oxidoreductase YjgC